MNDQELQMGGTFGPQPQVEPNLDPPIEETHPSANSNSLPPYDHGRAAWTLLLAAFIFEALLWGSLGCVIDQQCINGRRC